MEIEVIGAPTSAGAHHAGQDRAPAALREHGLLDRLRDRGVVVRDAGDVPGEVFRRDPVTSEHRNLDAVARVAAAVADEVERVLMAGRFALVLGDSVDSADLPLANYPHYGTGIPLDTAATVLRDLVALPGVRALTLTEVNPTYDPAGVELDRYITAVADAVIAALQSTD